MMKDPKGLRPLYRGLLCGLGGAGFALLLSLTGLMEPLDWAVKDAALRWMPDERADESPVEIIGIDQASIEKVAELTDFSWPWPRAFMGQVIDVLARAGAKAVIFDLLYLEQDIDRPEFPDGESDRTLGLAAKRHGGVIFAGVLREGHTKTSMKPSPWLLDLGNEGCWAPEPDAPHLKASVPVDAISEGAFGAAVVNFVPDGDGTLRRMKPAYRSGPVCAPYLGLAGAIAYLTDEAGERPPVSIRGGVLRVGDRSVPLDDEGRMALSWYGRGGPRGRQRVAYRYTPIYDVLIAGQSLEEGTAPALDLSRFRGKAVLIGSTAPGLMDLKSTPMSEFGPYPGVEIVATALENIVRGRSLQPISPLLSFLLACFLAMLIGVLSWVRPSIGWSSLVTFGVLGGYWGLSLFALSTGRVSMPIAGPLWAGFGAGLASLGWLYFSEGQDRKRIKELFGNYVAAPVVKKLLDDPASLQLGGERREMSVFFSDIAGYTDISESLTPEALVSQLNEYLSEVGQPILDREGYIDKYIGDAVMAIFGAPIAQADKEVQSVLAALDVQARLARMQELWGARSMPALHTRIGIATGHAVLGNIGSAQRVNYTAIGDTVNLAARLESANKHFGTSILIDGKTADMLGDRVRTREVGTIAVKGKTQGVRVFEPLCAAGEEPIYSESFVQAYSLVLQAYREMRFEDCARAAGEALSHRPEDIPASMYKEMSEEYMLVPPGENFDATVRLKSK